LGSKLPAAASRIFGAWRLLELAERYDLPYALLVNTELYDYCPELIAAFRGRGDEIVAVRIAWNETELRERAKRLGAVWRPTQKLWEISYGDAKRLGIAERIAPSDT